MSPSSPRTDPGAQLLQRRHEAPPVAHLEQNAGVPGCLCDLGDVGGAHADGLLAQDGHPGCDERPRQPGMHGATARRSGRRRLRRGRAALARLDGRRIAVGGERRARGGIRLNDAGELKLRGRADGAEVHLAHPAGADECDPCQFAAAHIVLLTAGVSVRFPGHADTRDCGADRRPAAPDDRGPEARPARRRATPCSRSLQARRAPLSPRCHRRRAHRTPCGARSPRRGRTSATISSRIALRASFRWTWLIRADHSRTAVSGSPRPSRR